MSQKQFKVPQYCDVKKMKGQDKIVKCTTIVRTRRLEELGKKGG